MHIMRLAGVIAWFICCVVRMLSFLALEMRITCNQVYMCLCNDLHVVAPARDVLVSHWSRIYNFTLFDLSCSPYRSYSTLYDVSDRCNTKLDIDHGCLRPTLVVAHRIPVSLIVFLLNIPHPLEHPVSHPTAVVSSDALIAGRWTD